MLVSLLSMGEGFRAALDLSGREDVAMILRGSSLDELSSSIGREVKWGSQKWRVVGVFEAGGSVSESEVWTDAVVLSGVYRRGNSVQIVRAQLTSAAALQTVRSALANDPRLNVSVRSEQAFYADQSRILLALIKYVGTTIAILMGVGAVFAAPRRSTSAASASLRLRSPSPRNCW